MIGTGQLAAEVDCRIEDSASDDIALDFGKPDLDLIEPTGIGRGVVDPNRCIGLDERAFMRPRSLPVFIFIVLAAISFSGCITPGFYRRVYLMIWKISPEQQAVAEKEVQRYNQAVEQRKRPPAKHRYIAVHTLGPNQKQRQSYLKKREAEQEYDDAHHFVLSPDWVEPDQLQCLMVFDTELKEFVGLGCYVVAHLPAEGAVAQYETYSAEYVSGETRSF
jgi:hypothetical protein